MTWRFRRSKTILPGVRLNAGKTGLSVTLGGPGAKHTVHSSGRTTTTVGIPGTGLFWTESSSGTPADTPRPPSPAQPPQAACAPAGKHATAAPDPTRHPAAPPATALVPPLAPRPDARAATFIARQWTAKVPTDTWVLGEYGTALLTYSLSDSSLTILSLHDGSVLAHVPASALGVNPAENELIEWLYDQRGTVVGLPTRDAGTDPFILDLATGAHRWASEMVGLRRGGVNDRQCVDPLTDCAPGWLGWAERDADSADWHTITVLKPSGTLTAHPLGYLTDRVGNGWTGRADQIGFFSWRNPFTREEYCCVTADTTTTGWDLVDGQRYFGSLHRTDDLLLMADGIDILSAYDLGTGRLDWEYQIPSGDTALQAVGDIVVAQHPASSTFTEVDLAGDDLVRSRTYTGRFNSLAHVGGRFWLCAPGSLELLDTESWDTLDGMDLDTSSVFFKQLDRAPHRLAPVAVKTGFVLQLDRSSARDTLEFWAPTTTDR